jgi:predicted site-specific integrase-resolvase
MDYLEAQHRDDLQTFLSLRNWAVKYVTALSSVTHDVELHLEKLGKPNKTNQYEIDTDMRIIEYNQRLIRSGKCILAQATNVIGINRVYLNRGKTDMTNFGVFDGWPGTYWIEKAKFNLNLI